MCITIHDNPTIFATIYAKYVYTEISMLFISEILGFLRKPNAYYSQYWILYGVSRFAPNARNLPHIWSVWGYAALQTRATYPTFGGCRADIHSKRNLLFSIHGCKETVTFQWDSDIWLSVSYVAVWDRNYLSRSAPLLYLIWTSG